ncbi:MAG TPA: chromosomal replication initiator protein DnaA [Ktedonobacterales bacterium]|nr:chromosomal replication initiator protein DnaA [Ktedonobacterales bacterium]
MNTAHVWRAALERLRRELSRAQYDTWLRGTQLALTDDGVCVLRVRTTFAKDMLETRYRERIGAAIAEVTGEPCRLEIAVDGESAEDEAPHHGTSRRAQSHAEASQYDRPQLFAAPDESLPAASHNPDTSSPRQGLPPAASSTRSERIRAALDRNRASGISGGGGQRSAGGDRDPHIVPGTRSGDERWTDGTAAIDPAQTAGARKAPHGQFTTAPTTAAIPDGETQRRATPDSPAEFDSAIAGGQSMFIPPPRLNARYTFATFIVGSANQLAHAASLAVAEAPGQAYNPLFLYGGVGLGKTHLLHAIGHVAVERNMSVLYVSSETFTNEIVNAIRYRTTEEFRAKYRSADLLLVDDIQFIAGKDSTEEEFFHTFNSLYESNRQIVICSDRPPKAIVSLEERLRSRFEWGLIADIQPPTLETRVAILRAKADMMRRAVPDEVIEYLATRIHSNIRELEGSLNRLLAFSQLQGMPLTIDTAKAALASLATDGRQRRVSVADVLEAVAEHYRISADDLRGKQRDKHIVVPRQVAMYLMRQETEASLMEIGQALGGRDHSTVLHGCEKINREVNEDSALRKEVLAIRQQLVG